LRATERISATSFEGYVDSLLTEVERILVDSVSDSPFNRYTADTTPIQQKVAHDYVLRIRAAMARTMKEQRIPFQGASVGSRWAANTTLLFASVAVDELHPDRMRGGNFIVSSTGRYCRS